MTKLRSNFVQEALLFLLFWPGPGLLLLLLVLLNLYISICLGSVPTNLSDQMLSSIIAFNYFLVIIVHLCYALAWCWLSFFLIHCFDDHRPEYKSKIISGFPGR